MQHYVRRRAAPALPLHYAPVAAYSKLLKPRGGGLCRASLRVGALVAGAVALALALWLSLALLHAYRTPRSAAVESERYYVDEAGARAPFPSLVRDAASVTVSVVVPAYNEEARMPGAMRELIAVLEGMAASAPPAAAAAAAAAAAPFTWELLIVDDGSADGTVAAGMALVREFGSARVRVLVQAANAGKGGAVRKGMLRARGQFLLFADADGATAPSALAALLDAARRATRGGLAVAVGSRAHLHAAGSGVQRSPARAALMWAFHAAVAALMGRSGIRDTQCGFKLFTRDAARALFPVQHIERFAFDVELVHLAVRKRIPMVEVPVPWTEVAGSKVDVLRDSVRMLRDILIIRIFYATGIWSDVAPDESGALRRTPPPRMPPRVLGSSAAGGGAPESAPARDGAIGGFPATALHRLARGVLDSPRARAPARGEEVVGAALPQALARRAEAGAAPPPPLPPAALQGALPLPVPLGQGAVPLPVPLVQGAAAPPPPVLARGAAAAGGER